MTRDPFATLAAVQRFLADDVLPNVPATLTGELRAAIKNLESSAAEFESLHPRTESEVRDVLGLCRELAETLIEDPVVHARAAAVQRHAERLDAGFSSTLELLQCHAESNELVSFLIRCAQSQRTTCGATESARIDHVLGTCYDTLGRHAASASRWQDVFAPAPDGDPD